MINTIGFRQAEKALQLGLLFNPDEALAIKLVDEVVEKHELIPKAEERIKEWLKIPSKKKWLYY
jgi:3,2-trans-enoyl-CoA isomerase